LGAKPGEKVDGVGSLPGTNFESGVAKLPDERCAEAGEKTHTIPGYVAAAKETLGQVPQAGVSATPKGANNISLPSQEVVGARPYENVSGVGALPGLNTESSVAKLPDQRNVEHGEISTNAPGSSTVDQAREAVGQIKPVAFDIKPVSKNDTSLPTRDKPDEVGISIDSKNVPGASGVCDHKTPAHETQQDLQSSTEATGITGIPNAVPSNGHNKDLPPKPEPMPTGGDEGGYHPAEPHSTNGKYSHAGEDDNRSASSNARPESTQSGGSRGTSPKKVGFREKVSGGSKVLIGKLGHNPEKVEEGKRILHGEA
jgi:hypothetical protein